jgi:RNA polymerase sigma-70 factor (ECF subfamily)
MKADSTYGQIAREHGAMIKRIAGSYEANAHLAEELVQDIHLALWRALPSFRGNASLRTFVARIATNRAITHVARAVRLPGTAELDPEFPASAADPESQALSSNEQSRLAAEVRGLPLAYRQVTGLTLEGLTPAEIAETLGITANAVAIRLSRAKEMLRDRLGEPA